MLFRKHVVKFDKCCGSCARSFARIPHMTTLEIKKSLKQIKLIPEAKFS